MAFYTVLVFFVVLIYVRPPGWGWGEREAPHMHFREVVITGTRAFQLFPLTTCLFAFNFPIFPSVWPSLCIT